MYRPPETDSEDDDYDGFSFGGNFPRPRISTYLNVDPDKELYDAIWRGDLEKLKEEISRMNFNVNDTIRNGLTLLHYACRHCNLEIVKYLLEEKKANCNRQVDSTTPLMEISSCCRDDNRKPMKAIVEILIENGAVVNVSDKYGMTPLIFACKNGLTDVVKLLIKSGAYLEASDNQGSTPIFFAVEGNFPEVVRILIESGAEFDIVNRTGFTPKQIAEFNRFTDVLNVFPFEEDRFIIPTEYLSYNDVEDEIPQIFETNIPPYFPDIDEILFKNQLQRFLEHFAENGTDLFDFLTMTDEKLKEIGIGLSVHREKILLAILNYHLQENSKTSIACVKKDSSETFYDILRIVGNHLKNLIQINASLRYIEQNLEKNVCGEIAEDRIRNLKESVRQYRNISLELRKTVKYLRSFSPAKPPLFIDYEEYKSKKRRSNVIKKCVKYSIIIGISTIICLKVKKIF